MKLVKENLDFEKGQDPKRSMGIGQGSILDMLKGVGALRHFLYYADHNFVRKIWGTKWPADHIEGKLKGYIGDGHMDPNALMRFINSLDGDKQRDLFKYIIENHTDKW